ncbi:thioredoxin-like 3-2, chloroplastic [Dioscorea cayenensis subsp. rotundata]|uniref:Thioredoxin-like 3-2, chloroplastic n=1 Tax=Dioscorea cayennensis subsp. rotundata TaxID=55577 RepID=A0AB40C417_DIOCR|nr:thioredoxin-like 3-2, chloroplastic [Dioscorea cayenensis subsp. rotundata]
MVSEVFSLPSRLLRAPAAAAEAAAPTPSPSPSPVPALPRQLSILRSLFFESVSCYPSSIPWHRRPRAAVIAATAWRNVEDDFSTESVADDDTPTSIELVPVSGEQEFDRIIAEEKPVVFLWMANWCRKCIYLKPKLEKLAADYHPRIHFYGIDVNTVPQRLVNRAEITKMPTIQLWRDGKKQAEVIGGHQTWLVIDDVRRMIETEIESIQQSI